MQPKQQSDHDARQSPVAWFCVLESALRRGDLQRASEAQENLKRLGVAVRVQYPPLAKGVSHAT